MEKIRERARGGFIAVPRVGIGVGGLLLGVRNDGRIRLLDSMEIPCSHSCGPSFKLTADEKLETRKLAAEAGPLNAFGTVGVIGWYCSKTRGDATLNESDLNFYAELFPDPAQVALVVRPGEGERMHAAFFVRNEAGSVVKGAECVVDEWRPDPTTELEAMESERNAETVAAPQPTELAAPRETKLSDIMDWATSDADYEPPPNLPDANEMPAIPHAALGQRSNLFGVPGRVPPPPVRSASTFGWILGAVAAVAIGAAAFVTQDEWMPKPSLTLSSTELNGTLLIHWNPEALRGISHGSMFVNDGGQPTPTLIPLDRFQLNSGLLSYTPKSQRVTAKLDAGGTSAITAWFASVPDPPAAKSATAPPARKSQNNVMPPRP